MSDDILDLYEKCKAISREYRLDEISSADLATLLNSKVKIDEVYAKESQYVDYLMSTSLPKSNIRMEILKQRIANGETLILLDYEGGMKDLPDVGTPGHIDHDLLLVPPTEVDEEEIRNDNRPYYRKFEKRKRK